MTLRIERAVVLRTPGVGDKLGIRGGLLAVPTVAVLDRRSIVVPVLARVRDLADRLRAGCLRLRHGLAAKPENRCDPEAREEPT